MFDQEQINPNQKVQTSNFQIAIHAKFSFAFGNTPTGWQLHLKSVQNNRRLETRPRVRLVVFVGTPLIRGQTNADQRHDCKLLAFQFELQFVFIFFDYTAQYGKKRI